MPRKKAEFVVLATVGSTPKAAITYNVWRGGYASTQEALRAIKSSDEAPKHGLVVRVCERYAKEVERKVTSKLILDQPSTGTGAAE